MRISPKNGTLPLPKLPTISGMLRPNSVLPSLVNKANPPKELESLMWLQKQIIWHTLQADH